MCAQQRELRQVHLRFLNAHEAVVLEGEDDGILEAEFQLTVYDVVPQMLRHAEFVGPNLRRGEIAVCLAFLRRFRQSRLQNRKQKKAENKPRARMLHRHSSQEFYFVW